MHLRCNYFTDPYHDILAYNYCTSRLTRLRVHFTLSYSRKYSIVMCLCTILHHSLSLFSVYHFPFERVYVCMYVRIPWACTDPICSECPAKRSTGLWIQKECHVSQSSSPISINQIMANAVPVVTGGGQVTIRVGTLCWNITRLSQFFSWMACVCEACRRPPFWPWSVRTTPLLFLSLTLFCSILSALMYGVPLFIISYCSAYNPSPT